MKIAYEATYATRGKSGIPRDAKSLITILSEIQNSSLDLIFFMKDTFNFFNHAKSSRISEPQIIGSAFREENLSRSSIPSGIRKLLLAKETLKLKSRVDLIKLSLEQQKGILNNFSINETNMINTNIYVGALNYKARLARPLYLPSFKLPNMNVDVFIQQQLDPLKVHPRIAHVVRLHDILPLTHPQYFDDLSLKVFSKSFYKTVKLNPFFVVDSQDGAEALNKILNNKNRIFVIPPYVESFTSPKSIKTKQIIIVNTLEPRKRTQSAIDGFLYAKYAKYLDEKWKLVIVGGKGWLQDNLTESLLKKDFSSDIEFFENITDSRLAQLYDESSIVLSMSAGEGFGYPPLEGMCYGCLPVVSGIRVHRENLGTNAVYVEKIDPENIAYALKVAVEKIDLNQTEVPILMKKHVNTRFNKSLITQVWESTLRNIIDLHRNS